MRYDFASDNTAGMCPEAQEAWLAVDQGYLPSYGTDAVTAEACDSIRKLFQNQDCQVFLVFNGTAANSLALASLCHSYHSVICSEQAHVETDECGAPEFFSNGTKLLLAGGPHGKVDPAQVQHLVEKRRDIHYPKPKVLSLTQSSECGTVYSGPELQLLIAKAKELNLRVHMDGARFANACAHLGCPPAEIVQGVDVLSFGGCKMGMALGEAVVFFNKELAQDFEWRCKQAGQLASKMRYLAAPWVAMLKDDRWLTHAQQANAMAEALAQGLKALGLKLLYPREANAVFVQLPATAIDRLKEQWAFYQFIANGGARFVCNWSTQIQQVNDLLDSIRQVI